MNFSIEVKKSLLKLAIAVAAAGSLVSCFAGQCSQKIAAEQAEEQSQAASVMDDSSITEADNKLVAEQSSQKIDAEQAKEQSQVASVTNGSFFTEDDKKLIDELYAQICNKESGLTPSEVVSLFTELEFKDLEFKSKDKKNEYLQLKTLANVFLWWYASLACKDGNFKPVDTTDTTVRLARLMSVFLQREDGTNSPRIFCPKEYRDRLLGMLKRHYSVFVKDLKNNPEKFEELKNRVVGSLEFLNFHCSQFIDACAFVNPTVFINVNAVDFVSMDDGKPVSDASKLEKVFHSFFGAHPEVRRLLKALKLIDGHDDRAKFGYVVDKIKIKNDKGEYKEYSANEVTDDDLKAYVTQILDLPEVKEIFVKLLKYGVPLRKGSIKYFERLKNLQLQTLIDTEKENENENKNKFKEQFCLKDIPEEGRVRINDMSLRTTDGSDVKEAVEKIYSRFAAFVKNLVESKGNEWPKTFDVKEDDKQMLELADSYFKATVCSERDDVKALMAELDKVELVANGVKK